MVTTTLSARNRWLAVAAAYLALTLAYTRTLIPVIVSSMPGDVGDPAFNAWILWWNAHATPLTDAWWNAPMFFPAKGTFALSETLLALWPITTPLQWAGASPMLAYNVVFVLSFPTAALAAHALAHRLTGRHDAACVAGLAFGFAPFRAAQIWHMQLLWTCWMPLGLLALHRFLDERKRRHLALFGVCWLMNGLTTGYYLFFFAVLAGLWVLWFGRSVARDWTAIGATAVAASLPLVPLLIGYSQRQAAFGLVRSTGEIEFYSADLSGLWATMPFILPHAWTQYPKAEGALYPGIAIVALVIAGCVAAWRSEKRSRASFFAERKKKPGFFFLVAAALIAALAAVAWLQGGWSFNLIGLRVSLTHPLRAGFLALCLFTVGIAWDTRVVTAWRRRSPLMFYSAASVLMLLLALGPQAKLWGETFMADAPYAWLMRLPGGHALRVPARFAMLLSLCLSVAGSLACARLTRRQPRAGLTAAVCAAVLLEGFIWRLPVDRLGPALDVTVPGERIVLELPFGNVFTDTAAMLRSTTSGYTVVNGFSGYYPPHYDILTDGVKDGDRSVLTSLQESGPLLVYVHKARDEDNHLREFVKGVPGAQQVAESEQGIAYELAQRPRATAASGGRQLAVASSTANMNLDNLASMFDGDLKTRWTTGRAQAFRDEVRITLAEPATITRVEMDLGEFRRDAPRSLRVAVIPESGNPEIVWEDTTAGFALTAALADPIRIPLTLNLASRVRGREIVLRALSAHGTFAWSIAEIRIFGE